MSVLKNIILIISLTIVLFGVILLQHKCSHFPGGNSFRAVELIDPATILLTFPKVEQYSPEES